MKIISLRAVRCRQEARPQRGQLPRARGRRPLRRRRRHGRPPGRRARRRAWSSRPIAAAGSGRAGASDRRARTSLAWPCATRPGRRAPPSTTWRRPIRAPAGHGHHADVAPVPPRRAPTSRTSATRAPTCFATAASQQLTEDHSWVAEQVRAGHPHRGGGPRLQVQAHHHALGGLRARRPGRRVRRSRCRRATATSSAPTGCPTSSRPTSWPA